MRRLLLAATAIMAAVPAYATTITGTYTISETYNDAATSPSNLMGGGPAITGNYGTNIVNTASGTTGNFSFSLTAGGAYSTAVNLATFNPFGTCNGPGCTGGTSGTESDPISISFTFTSPSGASATTDTATFTAKYASPYLACDPGGDGHGKSDCVSWGTSPIVAYFNDGAVMNIKLNNASDWAITPTVQFQLVNGPTPAPEPISMSIIGVGIAGLGYIRSRRRAA